MPTLSRRRPDPRLFAPYHDPLPSATHLPQAEPDAIAQDFHHYRLFDFQRRRRRGGPSWRDLSPAYAFALVSHAQDWPRLAEREVDDELAAHWERMRGGSRLSWARVRPVVEDAWLALDHMPAAAIHAATHQADTH